MRKFLAVVAALALAACSASPPPPAQSGRTAAVFYGLGAAAFSDGMAEMADRANTNVYRWGQRRSLERELIRAHRSGEISLVNIAGHSLGGNSANWMANNLVAAGVPVGCVATLDPTDPRPVDSRVGIALNFMSPDFRAQEVPGARNIRRPDLNHVNMDNDPVIQDAVVRCLR